MKQPQHEGFKMSHYEQDPKNEVAIQLSRTRRNLLKMSALVAAGLAFSPCLANEHDLHVSPKPNFLVILVDDMGYSDPGFMGGEIATPHLDRLAREGLVMTQGMNCAVCSPTRAALLTGVFSHKAGYPDLPGVLNPAYPTLAELLKQNGYRTLMSGKWHLQQNGCHPEKRGFDRYFGLLSGVTSHWGKPWTDDPTKPAYSSDAIADHAVRFLQDDQRDGVPFFLYLAFTAPHYPIHAPNELIDRYEERYRAGWDELRQARWERQRQLQMFPPSATLPDDRLIGPIHQVADWAGQPVPAWASLPAERQADLVRRMAVHAAMVHQVDVNIGRVLAYLEKSGRLDNTIVYFASDNGCSAQGGAFGHTDNFRSVKSHSIFAGADLAELGGPNSNETLGAGWARVSNAPLRYSKAHAHAGGNTTPLLIWGGPVRKRAGQYDPTPCHVMDIAPTCLTLAGANPPATGFDGANLLPLLRGEPWPDRSIFFNLGHENAVVTQRWRMVKSGFGPWELYDHRTDPTETLDLARQHPETLQQLAADHTAWLKTMPSYPKQPSK